MFFRRFEKLPLFFLLLNLFLSFGSFVKRVTLSAFLLFITPFGLFFNLLAVVVRDGRCVDDVGRVEYAVSVTDGLNVEDVDVKFNVGVKVVRVLEVGVEEVGGEPEVVTRELEVVGIVSCIY